MTDDTNRPTGATLLRIIAPKVRAQHGVWITLSRELFAEAAENGSYDEIFATEVLETPMQPVAAALAEALDINTPETLGETVDLLQITELVCPCCDRQVDTKFHKPWLIDFFISNQDGSTMTGDHVAYKLETLALKMQVLH